MVIITLLFMLALTSVGILIYYTEFRGLKCRVKRLEIAMGGLNKSNLDLITVFEKRQKEDDLHKKEVMNLLDETALHIKNNLGLINDQDAKIVELKKELSKLKYVKKDSTPKVKRVKKEVEDGKKAGK